MEYYKYKVADVASLAQQHGYAMGASADFL